MIASEGERADFAQFTYVQSFTLLRKYAALAMEKVIESAGDSELEAKVISLIREEKTPG